MKMHLKNRTLTVIIGSSGFYIKLCNCWDGKFKEMDTENVYPLFGFKRESKTLLLDQDTPRPRERLMTGWILTIPYVLVYYMTNLIDHITVTVPDDTINGEETVTIDTNHTKMIVLQDPETNETLKVPRILFGSMTLRNLRDALKVTPVIEMRKEDVDRCGVNAISKALKAYCFLPFSASEDDANRPIDNNDDGGALPDRKGTKCICAFAGSDPLLCYAALHTRITQIAQEEEPELEEFYMASLRNIHRNLYERANIAGFDFPEFEGFLVEKVDDQTKH